MIFFKRIKKKKRLLLISSIIIIFSIIFSLMIYNQFELSTPNKTIKILEKSLYNENKNSLNSVFLDDSYSSILEHLFFKNHNTFNYSNNLEINNLSKTNFDFQYGFPENNELSKPIITTYDIKEITKNKIKYFSDNGAITIISLEKNNRRLYTGIVLEKFENKWFITRMYDFVIIDSDFFEIKDFSIDFFKKEFMISLDYNKENLEKNIATSALFNLYLDIENVTIEFINENSYNNILTTQQNNIICSYSKENINLYNSNNIIPKDQIFTNNLFSVDNLIIKGTCDYSKFMSNNLEDKYLLKINFLNKNNSLITIFYYGDLRL
jgi:hypothetical protein